MNFLSCVLFALTIASLPNLNRAALAQAQSTCFMAATDEYIEVGKRYPVGQTPEPAYITGNEVGSRVNIRTGPGLQYNTNGHGLVGEDITALDMALDTDCAVWIRVRFPSSGHEAWIHQNYFSFYYGRGFFD
jgi:hypothetical protein